MEHEVENDFHPMDLFTWTLEMFRNYYSSIQIRKISSWIQNFFDRPLCFDLFELYSAVIWTEYKSKEILYSIFEFFFSWTPQWGPVFVFSYRFNWTQTKENGSSNFEFFLAEIMEKFIDIYINNYNPAAIISFSLLFSFYHYSSSIKINTPNTLRRFFSRHVGNFKRSKLTHTYVGKCIKKIS